MVCGFACFSGGGKAVLNLPTAVNCRYVTNRLRVVNHRDVTNHVVVESTMVVSMMGMMGSTSNSMDRRSS
jgi:hypothetical protein